MKKYPEIQEQHSKTKRPSKIFMIGQGNFLRAFVADFVARANEAGVMNHGIEVLKPIVGGSLETFHRQNYLYTVALRGIQGGKLMDELRLTDVLQSAYEPADEYEQYMKIAELPELEFIISNTTEAGITDRPEDKFTDSPPESYPGKLTQFLYRRFEHFEGAADKGVFILPVELIEANGVKLKEIVLLHAERWTLGDDFINWLNNACTFASTLVDRIVSGYPGNISEFEERMGYKDDLLAVAEPFGLWVIESDNPSLAERFPLDKAGCPVVFTDDQTPYRERKVRILNGAHTSSVLAAHLGGLDNVEELMKDPDFGTYLRRTVLDEIVPTVPLPLDEATSFAEDVFERFENPFVDHKLLSISLNSISKWRSRILPSLKDSYTANGTLPERLVFSLASLLAFYQTDKIQDDPEIMAWFKAHRDDNDYITKACSNASFWGEDLTAIPGFSDLIELHSKQIRERGIREAISNLELLPSLQVHPDDDVAVALKDLPTGIAKGHKYALRDLPQGHRVRKYGHTIGILQEDVKQGEHIHEHNMKTSLGEILDYDYQPIKVDFVPQEPRTFMGYRRKNGRVGVRNELWIVPTVGCINALCSEIQELVRAELRNSEDPRRQAFADSVFAFEHPYGCSQLGDDLKYTQRALGGLITHPNAGGTLVIALGCENNILVDQMAALPEHDPERVRSLHSQSVDDEVAEAIRLSLELIDLMVEDEREECPASDLIVGLKCGGSDGFSGLSANPLLGEFSDVLVAQGGSTILTEVPEMFGAETILMNRAKDEATFLKTVDLINDFKRYFMSYDEPIYENPSPGNKEGGITTLEEKSLGCTQKSGSSTVMGVLDYGEPLKEQGLNLLQGPGNDLVSSTAMAVSGAQIVLFTTGRGTPFACPVPTIKISTNSDLARRKEHWIDFDAGPLLQGVPMDELREEFMDLVLDVASGVKTAKSEAMHRRGLAIFKDGVTL